MEGFIILASVLFTTLVLPNLAYFIAVGIPKIRSRRKYRKWSGNEIKRVTDMMMEWEAHFDYKGETEAYIENHKEECRDVLSLIKKHQKGMHWDKNFDILREEVDHWVSELEKEVHEVEQAYDRASLLYKNGFLKGKEMNTLLLYDPMKAEKVLGS